MADTTTLADAVEQLYAAPPAEFVRTRAKLAADAKVAGDTDTARDIRALRKPTVAAHLINRLVRRHPDDLEALADLGNRLRAAQSRLDGTAMKELGAERLALVGRLTDRAGEAVDPLTAAVREQVSDTLTAALADPAAHSALSGGALVTSLRYNGFGEVDLSDALAAPLRVIQGGGSTGPGDRAELATARADAQRDAARRASAARSARAQATLERAEEQAAAAGRAADRAEQQLTDARKALRSAQAACTAANRAQEEAQAEVTAASAERERLQSGASS